MNFRIGTANNGYMLTVDEGDSGYGQAKRWIAKTKEDARRILDDQINLYFEGIVICNDSYEEHQQELTEK